MDEDDDADLGRLLCHQHYMHDDLFSDTRSGWKLETMTDMPTLIPHNVRRIHELPSSTNNVTGARLPDAELDLNVVLTNFNSILVKPSAKDIGPIFKLRLDS